MKLIYKFMSEPTFKCKKLKLKIILYAFYTEI